MYNKLFCFLTAPNVMERAFVDEIQSLEDVNEMYLIPLWMLLCEGSVSICVPVDSDLMTYVSIPFAVD